MYLKISRRIMVTTKPLTGFGQSLTATNFFLNYGAFYGVINI